MRLVMRAVSYLSHFDKTKIRMLYCAVDLDAWRRLASQKYTMLTPIDLCNEFCVAAPSRWHMNSYSDSDILEVGSSDAPDGIYFVFDRGEEFTASFRDKWKMEMDDFYERGQISPWALINGISEAESRRVQGLQAADVIAWSVNREATSSTGLPGVHLAEILKQVVPHTYLIWDEERLRRRFGPVTAPSL